jgi:hypothetical protein
VQPSSPDWNLEGIQNNAIQRVRVVVGASADSVQVAADAR